MRRADASDSDENGVSFRQNGECDSCERVRATAPPCATDGETTLYLCLECLQNAFTLLTIPDSGSN